MRVNAVAGSCLLRERVTGYLAHSTATVTTGPEAVLAIQKALSQAGGIADVSETPLSLTSQINWRPTMGKELQPLAFESRRGDTQDTDTMLK